jgi:hypothetical protein
VVSKDQNGVFGAYQVGSPFLECVRNGSREILRKYLEETRDIFEDI